MAIICPNCGSATGLKPVRYRTKGMLADSLGDDPKFEDVLVPLLIEGSANRHYAVSECFACGRDFVAEKEHGAYGDWIAVWPLTTRKVSGDIPNTVAVPLREALLCLSVGALMGTLLACRMTLIRLQRQQNAESLKDLADKGIISPMLWGQADEVRLWANTIGHDDIEDTAVTREGVEELAGYVEALLDQVYVQPAKLASLKEKRQKLEKGSA